MIQQLLPPSLAVAVPGRVELKASHIWIVPFGTLGQFKILIERPGKALDNYLADAYGSESGALQEAAKFRQLLSWLGWSYDVWKGDPS